MAWYEDLALCDYFGSECAPCLRVVGWLEQGRPFATGRVQPDVYARLIELLKEPWQPGMFAGFHRCDLCLYEGVSGRRNLFVPAGEVAFVCPELVAHYMNAHAYRPPDEFSAAVLACPPMRSVTYLKALLAAARPLVQTVG
jgi:hypothetical protein